MAKVPAIVPVSDLRQDAAGVLKSVKSSNEPLFITQRGRATAVLMSLDAYERFEAERAEGKGGHRGIMPRIGRYALCPPFSMRFPASK